MTRGFADLHVHQFASLGFGGLAFHGRAFGDPAEALDHCDRVHGPGGANDNVGTAMSYVYGRLAVGHLVGGFPEFDGWPRWTSNTHQAVFEDWLKRAVDGGLRLIVMLAVNNEFLAGLVNKAAGRTVDDMEAVDLQLAAARTMERYIDAKAGGPGLGWYRIVTTPDEARGVIRAGKLAVVLGIEVDGVFGARTEAAVSPAALRQSLDRYYDLGVRHVFPIHFADNGFGGTAFQNDLEFDPGYPVPSPINPRGGGPFVPPYPVQTADGTPAGYANRTGRCNIRGLTGLGFTMILEMINRGMIIDVDHMSARSRADTFAMCEPVDYPVVSGHTGFIDISNAEKRHEGQLTGQEFDRLRRLGGLVACIVRQGNVEEINTFSGPGQIPVPHTSGNTSNTWLQAYRYAATRGGGAVAFGSDFNGFAGLPGPRFGAEAAPGGQVGPPPTRRVIYPFVAAATGQLMYQSVVGNKTFDINDDGLAHIGLLPDFIADLEAQGVTAAELDPLMSSAEAYVDLWEKAHEHRGGRLLALDPATAGGRTPDDLTALGGSGPILERPAVVTVPAAGGDEIHVFARGVDEHLHHWLRTGAGGWKHTDVTAVLPPSAYWGHGRPPGPFNVTSAPTAIRQADGTIGVAATGPGAQLVLFTIQGGGAWTPQDLVGDGIDFTGSPVMVVDTARTTHILVRGFDGRLIDVSQAATPIRRPPVGGQRPGPPVIQVPGERLEALPNQEPWLNRRLDGADPVQVIGPPTAAVGSDGVVRVAARGPGGHLVVFSSTSNGWADLDVTAAIHANVWGGPGRSPVPATVTSDPAAGVGGDGVVRLYARGPGGQLLMFSPTRTGSWAVYDDADNTGTGLGFVGTPSVARDAAGNAQVAVRLADGRLGLLSQPQSAAAPPGPILGGGRPRPQPVPVGPGGGLHVVPVIPPPPWAAKPFVAGGAAGGPAVAATSGGLVVCVRGM